MVAIKLGGISEEKSDEQNLKGNKILMERVGMNLLASGWVGGLHEERYRDENEHITYGR